jgi:hypothetical protein
MEESLAKTTLHQAAVGNNGADKTKSRSLNKKDRDLQLASLVKNFHNLNWRCTWSPCCPSLSSLFVLV